MSVSEFQFSNLVKIEVTHEKTRFIALTINNIKAILAIGIVYAV